MVLVFSLTEKNKYKLLDENAANKIELIKIYDDKSHESKPLINDDEIIKK